MPALLPLSSLIPQPDSKTSIRNFLRTVDPAGTQHLHELALGLVVTVFVIGLGLMVWQVLAIRINWWTVPSRSAIWWGTLLVCVFGTVIGLIVLALT